VIGFQAQMDFVQLFFAVLDESAVDVAGYFTSKQWHDQWSISSVDRLIAFPAPIPGSLRSTTGSLSEVHFHSWEPASVLQDRLFRPLGMNDTALPASTSNTLPDLCAASSSRRRGCQLSS